MQALKTRLMKTSYFAALLLVSTQALAWSNHTLITHNVLSTLPLVANRAEVKVETLESFLLATEKALPDFLEKEEAWLLENLFYYAPRPAHLAFKATGNEADIRSRFTRAIRINPHARLSLYLQLMPGDKRPDLEPLLPSKISVFKDVTYLDGVVDIVALEAGQMVAPLDVVLSGSDEPDHGLDIGLFTDSKTDYGKEYGFGKQAFGNANLEYGTQAPFHMGFYHEADIIYAAAPFLKRTYPEFRIHLFKRLAEFAFSHGHDYWGWRFMGMGLHYIGDFSNPYHITPVPGNHSLTTLWLGVLDIIDIPGPQADAVQLVSNRHTAIENFQGQIMTKAWLEKNTQHEMLQALTAPEKIVPYVNDAPVSLFAKVAYDKAVGINGTLLNTMPKKWVDDASVEFSHLPVSDRLEQAIIEHKGVASVTELSHGIAALLKDYAQHGASYVKGILDHKPNKDEK